MKKILKKSGVILSAALGISLMGQVAYAVQTTYATRAIGYNFRLPDTGYKTTDSTTKPNKDGHADNYVSYLGWEGSGIDWWIMNSSGKEITKDGHFSTVSNGTPSKAYYKKNYGNDYYGHSVYAKIKTDSSTWNECDVRGTIYP